MEILIRIIGFAIGYLCGNISPGLIFAKLKNKDIRSEGSGNLGTTNVTRTLGKKLGALTLVIDVAKALVPALIMFLVLRGMGVEEPWFYATYVGFGAVIGHIFPVFLGFKGGKGIATTLGFMLFTYYPPALICLVIFIIIVLISRYVSLGSVICMIIFPIITLIFLLTGLMWYPNEMGVEIVIMGAIDAVICIIKHRENIVRLINGNENKFGSKK